MYACMYPEGTAQAKMEGIGCSTLNVAWQTEVKSLFGEEDAIQSYTWAKPSGSNSATAACRELRADDRDVFMSTS